MRKRRLITGAPVIIAGSLAIGVLLWCGLYYYLGVWPLDLWSSKEILVGETYSAGGDRFRIMQKRTALPEGYETWLQHTTADGKSTVSGIDCDDPKEWKCSLQVDEQRKKLLIGLRWHHPIEYSWEKRKFVALPRPRGFWNDFVLKMSNDL